MKSRSMFYQVILERPQGMPLFIDCSPEMTIIFTANDMFVPLCCGTDDKAVTVTRWSF